MSLRRVGERGQVTAFVVCFAVALLLLAGLTIDGGRAISARLRALDEAQQAARSGAEMLDVQALRSSVTTTLDPSAAQQAARSYLTATGDSGQVTVAGDTVDVTVTVSVPTQILGLVGVHDLTVTETVTATAERGVVRTGP